MFDVNWKNNKSGIPVLLLVLAALCIMVLSGCSQPQSAGEDPVPTHWSSYGEADSMILTEDSWCVEGGDTYQQVAVVPQNSVVLKVEQQHIWDDPGEGGLPSETWVTQTVNQYYLAPQEEELVLYVECQEETWFQVTYLTKK